MTTAEDLSRVTEYDELLHVLQPRAVTSQEQAGRYLDAIDTLTDLSVMSTGQQDMVGLLGQLVYAWEEEHEDSVTATPQELVRFLLEENGLTQQALVPTVFANRQNVSEFLAGRRALSFDRVAKLAVFFNLSPAAFYPAQKSHETKCD